MKAAEWKFKKNTATAEEIENEIKILKHAVPGDVLVKTSSGAHIVIIKDINDVIDDFADTEIIHAAQGTVAYENAWCVFIGKWNDASYGSHPKESYNLR